MARCSACVAAASLLALLLVASFGEGCAVCADKGAANAQGELSNMLSALKRAGNYTTYLRFINSCVTERPSLIAALPGLIANAAHSGMTILAPTDAAFTKANIFRVINDLSSGHLPDLFMLTMFPYRVPMAQFYAAPSGQVYYTYQGTPLVKLKARHGLISLVPQSRQAGSGATIVQPGVYQNSLMAVHGVNAIIFTATL